jgi:uncharacterized protein (DUF58 family)
MNGDSSTYLLPPCDGLDARQFQVSIKRLADSLNFGTNSSPFLGSGQEYAQSRPYQFGDPIKSIDWRVTARTGRPFVKEYEATKRMPAWLVVDGSASMAVTSQPLSKYAWAVQLAGGLAMACLDRANPVGVMTVGGGELRLEPSLSRDRVMLWLHKLRHFRCDEPTTLGSRLGALMPSLPSRALLIVLSDLHDPRALPVLKIAGQRHDVIVIQLQDPAEEPVVGGGFFRGREAESGRHFLSQGKREMVDFATAAAQLRVAGVDHLRLRTDRPVLGPLRQYVKSRGLLGRMAR